MRARALQVSLLSYWFVAHSSAYPQAKDSLPPSLEKMVVTARPGGSRVDIAADERVMGIADDLGSILFLKPGVARVPEAGSLLMVNGHGPYDNLFLVRGVPVFAPAHFAGHSFADRSVVSLATPQDIEFHTSRFAGLYSGASGSVVSINPHMLKSAGVVPRPEVALNYGTLGADIAVTIPVRKERDRYQFTYRPSNKRTIWIDDLIFSSSKDTEIGLTQPSLYTDLQVLGEQSVGSVKLEQLVWLGLDQYLGEVSVRPATGALTADQVGTIPWGIAALGASRQLPTGSWAISAGGARQYHFEGQRLGPLSTRTQVRRDVGSATGEYRFDAGSLSSVTLRATAQGFRWRGRINTNLRGRHPLQAVEREGTGANIQAHWGWKRSWGGAVTDCNINTGLFFPGARLFADPGLSVSVPLNRAEVGAHAGIVTSQPDVRGVPERALMQRLAHTYQALLSGSAAPLHWLGVSGEAFVKWKDRQPVPSPSPRLPAWDPAPWPHLLSGGANLQVDLRAGRRVSLRTTGGVLQSKLVRDGKLCDYTYESPWICKSILAFSPIESTLTAYAIATFAAGMPYHDLTIVRDTLAWAVGTQRYPSYRRLDLKVEWRQRVDFVLVSQFDVYALAENLEDLGVAVAQGGVSRNVREYYWSYDDGSLRRMAVGLKPFDLHLGLRVHFRLLRPSEMP